MKISCSKLIMLNENYFLLKILEQLNKKPFNKNNPLLIIADNEQQSKKIFNKLKKMSYNNIDYYPAWDTLAYEKILPSPIVRSQRLTTLFNLLFKQTEILITNFNAIMAFCPPKEFIASNVLIIKVNQQLSLSDFCGNIAKYGYNSVTNVTSPGQFARRGSIVDLFPISQKKPCRIDWLDDTIESIRIFDPETQKSITTIDTVNALTAHEYQTPTEHNQYALCKLHTSLASFIDYLADNTVLIKQTEFSNNIVKEIFQNHAKSFLQHPSAVSPKLIWDEDIEKKLLKFKLAKSKILKTLDDTDPINNKINVFIGQDIAPSNELQNKYPNIKILDILSFDLAPGIYYLQSELSGSASYNKLNLICVNQIQQSLQKTFIKSHKDFNPVDAFSDLQNLHKDDYVVHQTYGIGRFAGLHTISINNEPTELLVIKYADEDVIYLPLYNLHMLSRYYQSNSIKLSKLGSKKWEQQKLKAIEHIDQLTAELINTYADQKNNPGIAIKVDNASYQEFYAQFPFNYTADQEKAIKAIMVDLQANKNMDRLICGDVGFGKTEVAIHAAFITAMAGYQVCVLAPTTILTEQHYLSFKNRLDCFGLNIESLSRHTLAAKKHELKHTLSAGQVDIVIATHAILNQAYQFKKLALVIIDEEHRFGVKQKELIRNYRKTSNMLALSATPIPRTLNMSLSKLRDISIIQTYPDNRLNIVTQIAYINSETVYMAIAREIQRGGQVYFCLNNIAKLTSIKETLRKKFPNIEIDIVHGQMIPAEIKITMQKFKNQKTQILVCTTLIESGIDIPNANTIIIYRADLMGLSQLHQLRGRVGRSNIQAFAYLCVEKDYELEKDAKLRLDALISNQKVGSGFSISMQDLEIRGAGALLGAKQSGVIQQIGMATYLKLLNKSINLSSNKHVEHDLQINTTLPCFIPHEYIPNEDLRLDLYCRLNRCADQKQLDEISSELKDRFGDFPESIKNLIFVSKLKFLYTNTAIVSIIIKESYYKVAVLQQQSLLRNIFTKIKDPNKLLQFNPPNILKISKVKNIDNAHNLLSLLNQISQL